MIIRKIKGTEILASCIGYGTSKLHHVHSFNDRLRLLNQCYDLGINFYDTARMYGDGCSESSLSHLIKGRRSNFIIATKFGRNANFFLENLPIIRYPFYGASSLINKLTKVNIRKQAVDFSLINCRRSLSLSLKALQTDYIDILHMHEPSISDLIDNHDLLQFFDEIRRSGVVRYIGVSGDLDSIRPIMASFDDAFDLIQVEDSILHNNVNYLEKIGYEPSITFGYFRDAIKAGFDPKHIINLIADRTFNRHALFSSTDIAHIEEVVSIFSRNVMSHYLDGCV